jgi:hypothetical protein
MVKHLLTPAPLTLAIWLVLAISAVVLHQPNNLLAEVLGLLAIMFPSGLLVLCAHELGHVVGGLLSGYRFVALICGPIAVWRGKAWLQARRNEHWSLYPGATLMAPRGPGLPPTRDAVSLYAGGPLASLLLGALGMSLHFGLGLHTVKRSTIAAGTHTFGDQFLGNLTLMLGVLSLAIVCATAIPNALGGFLSDGAAIRMLLKGGHEAERLLAINALMGQFFAGVRPRDWSPEFVRQAACVQDGSAVESGAASYGLLHALDQGDLTAARGYLARMQATSGNAPALSQGELRGAEAWLAVADGHITEARAAFEQMQGAMVDEFSRRRVLAAILLAEGKEDEGMAAAREGLALMEQQDNPFPGTENMEREWLEQLADGRLPTVLTPKAIED